MHDTGNSPDDGNGDSSNKRANAIRPYGIRQLIDFTVILYKIMNKINCLNNKISRRGELNSPFYYTGKFTNSRHKSLTHLLTGN